MLEKELDITTEEKIKQAAKIVFHKKGFAATRTRDIAEEAGINLALLNYYFRSKEKLFELIMEESLRDFLLSLTGVISDESTSLQEKIPLLVDRYITMLISNRNMPIFILSEIHQNPELLVSKFQIKEIMMKSAFVLQFQDAVATGKIAQLNVFQFIMNLMGLIIFPFMVAPMLKQIGDLQEEQFVALIMERKKLIPIWIEAILKKT
ncbi:MAG: TetR/AcrR family transcriptional regulator [Bacteroidetes bacterium]|nr:TetR/AcrR family transcriptional regulator [Bacteroidota bacterium]